MCVWLAWTDAPYTQTSYQPNDMAWSGSEFEELNTRTRTDLGYRFSHVCLAMQHDRAAHRINTSLTCSVMRNITSPLPVYIRQWTHGCAIILCTSEIISSVVIPNCVVISIGVFPSAQASILLTNLSTCLFICGTSSFRWLWRLGVDSRAQYWYNKQFDYWPSKLHAFLVANLDY